MSRFEYKAAALSSPQTVVWDNEGISLSKGDETTRLAWADIVSARYWTMRLKTIDYYGFALKSSDGDSIELNLNIAMGTHASDPLLTRYFSMLQGVSVRLKACLPDLRVDYGQAPKFAWAYFGIGAVCLAFALFMLYFLITDVPDRLAQAAPPVGIMAVFGAFLSWSFRPGRPTVTLSMDGMAELAHLKANPDQR